MSESWKQWEGQVVEGKFPLQRYLGGSEHSSVFLTERGAPPQKAAIKFVQVAEPDAELQLFRWKHAATLSYPNLLRLFESGRCRLGDFDLLYVVMEFAEENLSQFLPQRPLTPAEARDVLSPTLQALAFLHGQGLVHGHIRPSNILAIDDQLKLSSDGLSSVADHAEQSLLPAAEPPQPVPVTRLHFPSPYDAPEIARGVISPAGDIWSLGVTLVEALTQHLPASTDSATQDPLVPDTLPAVFLDIARHSLHRDSQRRWTVVDVSARLNPGSIAPYASAAKPANAPSPSPVPAARVPALIPGGASQPPVPARQSVSRPEPARPLPLPSPIAAKPQVSTQTVAVRGSSTRPRYDLVQPQLKRPPLLPLPKLNYLPLVAVAALALAAILVVPRVFRHKPPVQQAASAEEPQAPAAKPIPASTHGKNASKSTQKPALPAVSSMTKSAQHATPTSSASSLEKTSGQEVLNSSAPAKLTTVADPPRVEIAKSASTAVTQGEVLNQVMPEVSPGARATIRGTVHVAVKIHVDTAGNVAGAELFSPGPSRYFADQALQAAHRWDFAPAKVDGHAVPSEWVVRFEFTPFNTKAHPTQSTP